jgi:hypothetical protein
MMPRQRGEGADNNHIKSPDKGINLSCFCTFIFIKKILFMKTRSFFARFLIIFAVALIVNVLITLCWNYFIENTGWIVDWQTSFRIALLLAIVIPVAELRVGKRTS